MKRVTPGIDGMGFNPVVAGGRRSHMVLGLHDAFGDRMITKGRFVRDVKA
jgi:hypothetical protein